MAPQHQEQAEAAVSFFEGIVPETIHAELLTLAVGAPSTEKFTGESGLFSFVLSDQKLSTDPAVIDQVNQAKYYLKGFMSLVTAKLFGDNKNNVQAAFKVPPSDVKQIASHLPLISSFTTTTLANHKQTAAAEFATDFLKLALNLSVGNDAGAVKNVMDWLNTLGKQITISASSQTQTYNVTVFSGIIEVMGTGGIVDVEPQFCISGASLSIAQLKAAVSGCAKAQSFKLDYQADNFRAGLNMDALKDPKVKAAVDKLVTDGTVKSVDDSANFFGVS